jgi:hypothetical protein
MPVDGECCEQYEREIEQMRAALRHAISRLSELEYHWHGGDFWGPIKPYTATGPHSVFGPIGE